MRTAYSCLHYFTVLVVITLFFSTSFIVIAGDLDDPRPDYPVPRVLLHEGCEPESGSLPPAPSIKKPRNPLDQAIHEARDTGDLELLRILEQRCRNQQTNRPGSGHQRFDPLDHPDCETVFVPGDPAAKAKGKNSRDPAFLGSLRANFGADRHVAEGDGDSREYDPCMAISSDGKIFVAWTETSLTYDYIQVYGSVDQGISWYPYGGISHPSGHVREPSLTIAEGTYNRLIMAYVYESATYGFIPQIAMAGLISWGPIIWSIYYVPFSSTYEKYSKPVVWNDAQDFTDYYAYLTCEAVKDSAVGDVKILAWRSTDMGENWDTEEVVMGGSDSDWWRDPDGAYGTTDRNVYVAAYNSDDQKIHVSTSTNFGISFGTPDDIHTFTTLPTRPIDPEIEAAAMHDNVMLCCTREYNGSACIGQMYSTDSGATWTTLYVMSSYTSAVEFAPSLTANIAGGNWHLVYTGDHHVHYTSRPQDLSGYWDPTPDIVDDRQITSYDYPGKGIACFQDSDECATVWVDYRDGLPDYDVYFDHTGNTYDVYVPLEYSTIQAGIDESPLTPTTVHVSPGTYVENVNFNGKAVNLRSTEGATHTVIDGNDLASVVSFMSGEGSDSILDGFIITNGTEWYGGGVYTYGSKPVIRNNVIVDNLAKLNGGGICCYEAFPEIINNTIIENSALYGGGGLWTWGGGSPLVKNCIFWDNTGTPGPEIHVDTGTLSVEYSDVEGGWPGTGNINANPLLAGVNSMDFHIQHISPCREAGTNVGIGPSWLDFDCSPRRSGTVDIGADEYSTHLYYLGDATPGGSITMKVVGTPGASPVALFFSGAIYSEPAVIPEGEWWLVSPFLGPYIMPAISTKGFTQFSGTVPLDFPAPATLYCQGVVGPVIKITNLCLLEIK